MKHHHLTRTAFGSALTGTAFVVAGIWTGDDRFGLTGGMLLALAVLLWIVAGIVWSATEDLDKRAQRIAVHIVETAQHNLKKETS